MIISKPWLGRVHDASSAVAWIAGAAFGLAALYSLTSVAINGPQMRAAADAALAQAIDQENDTFCRKYGMAPRTDAYQSCKLDLIEIRQKQAERWAKEASFY